MPSLSIPIGMEWLPNLLGKLARDTFGLARPDGFEVHRISTSCLRCPCSAEDEGHRPPWAACQRST